jgi:predicted phage terminase large subunit-like protein
LTPRDLWDQLQAEKQKRATETNLRRLALATEDEKQRVREECKTLYGFIKWAWPILHPVQPFRDGPHIKFIADHLEAITYGKFLELGYDNRLRINVPPRTMKSLMTTVFWPAWEWGPAGLSSMSYIATSYRADFCERDSLRFRQLVEHQAYQALWPITLIRMAARSIENDKHGKRDCVPFASLTGSGADRLMIDDPHSVDTAESDVDRTKTAITFRESAALRVNDARSSAIILIMQRLHSNDVSGIEESLDFGYVRIVLPMEYEGRDRCRSPLGGDWRTKEGDLLFPSHMPRETVERDKIILGGHAVAGQFQQRPSPREGNLFKRYWFEGRILKEAPPLDRMLPVSPGSSARFVRHWDLAASKSNTSARTSGVKMGKTVDNKYIVMHCIATREEGNEVRRTLRAIAEADGRLTEVSIPQDPGQAGKVQVADLVGGLAGFVVHHRREDGEKYTRAEPFAAQCEGGNVYLVAGEWVDEFLDELCLFPSGRYKDRVDACSGAFARLPQVPKPSFAMPYIATRERNVPGMTSGPQPNWSGTHAPNNNGRNGGGFP